MNEKETETNSPCPCTQATVDLLKSVSPIKEGMLKEVKCKECGKTFLTNFETEYCFDCRIKSKEK
ncbi:hypothetical protein KEJ32_04005 [Candidatus Bathyarchaeota archaeon]|nr:hypothetical protein [Candidatus Bathyarchaeota archaeon]